MNQRGRLPDVCAFTVQIRHAETNKIAGTGILIASDKVITCAHVLCDAGINPKRGQIRGFWDLFFESLPLLKARQFTETVIVTESVPYVHQREREVWKQHTELAAVKVRFVPKGGRKGWERRAELLKYFPKHDDDVVLLRLLGEPIPIGLDQIAALGSADESPSGSRYLSYGYPQHEADEGGLNVGFIQGTISPPTEAKLQADPLQLEPSQEVTPGMSGAAVLDTHQDLVVGLMVKTKRRSGGGYEKLAWAVNARVLSLDPFNLTLQKKPGQTRPLPYPQTDIDAAQKATTPYPGLRLSEPDPQMQNWVGREDLLANLDAEWEDKVRKVVALFGFGGEGKSFLARRWVDALLADPTREQPAGVFWWIFHTPDVEQFFKAALMYMTGGRGDLDKVTTAIQQANMIAAMLSMRRYLFVLDGIEVLQHQFTDRYGEFVSVALREFLDLFATPSHESFCLVTSRAPLVDLREAREYMQYEVKGLTVNEGRKLLQKAGVTGPNPELDRVVERWNGHALSLSLIGSYLHEQHGGDISFAVKIPAPTSDETQYERIHLVLRHYDEHLTDAERIFLIIFSIFRTPVPEATLPRVFCEDWGPDTLNAPIAALDKADFNALVKRLVKRRILRYDSEEKQYAAHPLIRDHYYRLAERDPDHLRTAHRRIEEYYLSGAKEAGQATELDDLLPLIEAVYHACRAGAYNEGYDIYRSRIEGNELFLSQKLNAYDTVAALVREFFPGGDTGQDPVLSNPVDQRFVLNRYGVAMMNTGQMRAAPVFYERAVEAARRGSDLLGEIHTLQNLSELRTYSGPIPASAEAARYALALVSHLMDESRRKEETRDSLAYQGWAAYLAGDMDLARSSFAEAEALQRELDPDESYLSDIYGVAHADFLRRAGGTEELRYARQITQANLAHSESEGERDNVSICHRVLGDIEAAAKRDDMALRHYNKAIELVRKIFERTVLLEALLARGRWAARRGDIELARNDLVEALHYAVAGGYGIYEADVRVALAWMYIAEGDMASARAEASLAQRQSSELGYHWGRVDADKVLDTLSQRTDVR